MKPTPFTLVAVVGLLTGCPPVWQKGRFTAEHQLGEPSRVHAWAFASAEPDGELDPVRRELRRQLAAAGWLESPRDQAELVVEPSLSVGEPEWVDATPLFLVAMDMLAAVTSRAEDEEESIEPVYERAWPKVLRIRIQRPGDGWVEYEGYASAGDSRSTPTTLAAALARELLASFPGPKRRSWTAALPPYPSSNAAGPSTEWTPWRIPDLPPRAVCTDAVPVVALRKARFWDRPDPRRDVAFRLEELSSGCASHAENGLVRVTLPDGRSGYILITSVRYHPGP